MMQGMPQGFPPGMIQPGKTPVLVLNKNTQRESGRKAQLANIAAARAVADVIRTSLGPQAMLKEVISAHGGVILTNDGNAILREIEVKHPASKSVIELSRTQDEAMGDGTTSVVVLAGEMLAVAEPFIERNDHPTIIIRAFFRALDDALKYMDQLAVPIRTDDREALLRVVDNCLGTKFVSRWGRLMTELALDAVQAIVPPSSSTDAAAPKTIDLKHNVRVERIPGGEMEECRVVKGVMLSKDVLHAAMARRIENPRVVLLDCGIEYKKLENAITLEASKAEDWSAILREEEKYVKRMCDEILKWKPDLVITEKGLSDLAQHYLVKNGVTALRRVRKTDSTRIALATGAKVVSRTEELREEHVGTKCGLYEVRLIGDE